MSTIEATSQTITRPGDTTAYTSGDLIANSTTNTLVTPFVIHLPFGRGFNVVRASLFRSTATVTNATFRLHLYKDSPTVTNGDNAAWLSIRGGYLGFIDIAGSAQAFSDASVAYGVYINNSVYAPMMIFADADDLVYGLLEARAAYGPGASETFYVTLTGQAEA